MLVDLLQAVSEQLSEAPWAFKNKKGENMTMEELKAKQSALADAWLEKFTSRKLLVWTTATVLMGLALIESGDWVMISALYIGGQSIVDAIAKMKGV